VKIIGVTHYLWQAFDHEGEVQESIIAKSRDHKAALKFLKEIDETLLSSRDDSDGSAPILWSRT
jgi:transposase-like protein